MAARWWRGLAACTALSLLAACSGGDGDVSSEQSFDREEEGTTLEERPGDAEEEAEKAEEEQTEGMNLDEVDRDDVDDVIIFTALEEIEAFWEDQFDEVAGDGFEPVAGGFVPYGPDREIPSCGGPLTYQEIAQNAFYCPIDDSIAWDTDNLTGDLLEQFGPFSLVIVMAHEYGHAVQARGALDPTLPTIAGEQQADCFAGAFTAHVAEGGSDVLHVSVGDLDSAVAGFISLRDAPGTSIADPLAHGSAFDRVGAFQDGFDGGVPRCAEYEDIFLGGGTTALPLQFNDEEDFRSGGNAPFELNEVGNIFDLTFGSLETYWTEEGAPELRIQWDLLFPDQVVAFDADDPSSYPECPGVELTEDDVAGQAFTCFGDLDDPDDDVIAFDFGLAAQLYEEVGDFAVSGIIAQQYSFIAQALQGNFGVEKADLLQADCYSGAWAGLITIETLDGDGQEFLTPEFDLPDGSRGGILVSAGDLDEAVQSFLLLGEGADPEAVGTAFERVAAFRTGFFDGLGACLDGGEPAGSGEEEKKD